MSDVAKRIGIGTFVRVRVRVKGLDEAGVRGRRGRRGTSEKVRYGEDGSGGKEELVGEGIRAKMVIRVGFADAERRREGSGDCREKHWAKG